jgi:zinc protease
MSKSALQQLILKLRTAKAFQDQGLLNRAMNLCYYELLDTADIVNTESLRYEQITTTQLQQHAIELLDINKCSLLQIQPK